MDDKRAEVILFTPSQNDIKTFSDFGFFISPVVIESEILDNASIAMEKIFKSEVVFDQKFEGVCSDTYASDKTFINHEYASFKHLDIRRLVHLPVISHIAGHLTGTKAIRLFADGLMCKLPDQTQQQSNFGWHTDKAYWPNCSSNKMLTAWIPFQDVTLKMGPLHVIKGSHKWEMTDELRKFCAAGNKDISSFQTYIENNQPDYSMETLLVKKGQVSFHDANLFHASGPNVSQIKRAALAIHLQDDSNTYVQSFKEDGSLIEIGYEKNCSKNSKGQPDYTDEAFFPLLWSSSK